MTLLLIKVDIILSLNESFGTAFVVHNIFITTKVYPVLRGRLLIQLLLALKPDQTVVIIFIADFGFDRLMDLRGFALKLKRPKL